jgi:hypothetical protein
MGATVLRLLPGNLFEIVRIFVQAIEHEIDLPSILEHAWNDVPPGVLGGGRANMTQSWEMPRETPSVRVSSVIVTAETPMRFQIKI